MGGGARVAMRLVALIAGMPPSFSWSGTLGILVGGGVAGALLGLLYVPLQRVAPWRALITAGLYGLILAGLTAYTFTRAAEGEFGLVAPWVGAALFVPLPPAFSLALAGSLGWWARRQPVMPHIVSLGQLALFGGSAGLAFTGMATHLDSTRAPAALTRMVEAAGVPFHQVREALSLLYLLFALAFLTLHLIAFWLGSEQRAIRWLGAGQLLLAWLGLRAQPLWPALVATDAGSRGEWIAWGAGVLVLAVVLTAMVRYRSRHVSRRPVWTWLLAGVALFGGGVIGIWLAILLWPDLQLRGWTALQTGFAVAPLSLPWLCLPAALIGAARAAAGAHP